MSIYLQSLRNNNFLHFLDWPNALWQAYDAESKDADSTIDLLVFTWFNNGFCEADAKKIALLYAFYDSDTLIFPANSEYALISIYTAVLNCMVYQSKQLQQDFICSDVLDVKGVRRFLKSKTADLPEEDFQASWERQHQLFQSWVREVTPGELQQASDNLQSILSRRQTAQNYCDTLSAPPIEGDELKASRQSVVQALLDYLNRLMELNEEASGQINTYIQRIRQLQPADFELEYLDSLVLPVDSGVSNGWVNTLLGFFIEEPSPPLRGEAGEGVANSYS